MKMNKQSRDSSLTESTVNRNVRVNESYKGSVNSTASIGLHVMSMLIFSTAALLHVILHKYSLFKYRFAVIAF